MGRGYASNLDADLLWYVYESMEEGDTDYESAIRAYVRGYANKGISDLIFNCLTQSSVIKSNVWSWLGDKTDLKVENGYPVDYSNCHRAKHISDMYSALSRDPFDIMIEEARLAGMTPWISVRMNDSHNATGNTFVFHGDIYYYSREKGYFVGKDAVDNPWFSECYNYAEPFVREKMLAFLEELLENHDFDGLELDFMRDIFCFDYSKNPECHKIMTEFIANAKALVVKAEKKRGHKIKICIRLCSDIRFNKIFGFDAEELMRRGLVDIIVPTSRWACTESNMPIAEWKKLAEPYGTEIYAGLEIMATIPWRQTDESLRGFARAYTEEGCDKLYLFNYFRTRGYDREPAPEKRRKCDAAYVDKFISDEYEAWLNSCLAAVDNPHEEGKVARFLLTRFDRDVVPRGETPFLPFPRDISGGAEFDVKTGDISIDDCYLVIGVSSGNAPSAEFDGSKAEYLGETKDIALVAEGVHNAGNKNDVYMSYTYHLYKVKGSSALMHKVKLSGDGVAEYLEVIAK